MQFFVSIVLRVALIFLFFLLAVEAKEDVFVGQVIAVSDGDTIKVLHNGAPEKIRLAGIDCPEKKQAFGNVAKKFASELCFGKQVTVLPVTHDRYSRTVARVVLPDGRILNNELVKAGYAWWYYKYSPSDQALARLQAAAQKEQIGLWADPAPIAPWDFRHRSAKQRK